MKTTNPQLNKALPVFPPQEEGFANSILGFAELLLEEIGVLSSLWSLSLPQAVQQLEAKNPVNDGCIFYGAELLETVVELAIERARELPDIESGQYDESEVYDRALEIAFELVGGYVYRADGDDEQMIHDLAIKLAIQLDDEIEEERYNYEALLRYSPR
jgi:hypothetical protein